MPNIRQVFFFLQLQIGSSRRFVAAATMQLPTQPMKNRAETVGESSRTDAENTRKSSRFRYIYISIYSAGSRETNYFHSRTYTRARARYGSAVFRLPKMEVYNGYTRAALRHVTFVFWNFKCRLLSVYKYWKRFV